MRHPHPLLYWIAFGAPILIGIVQAMKLWSASSVDERLVWLVLKTVVVAMAPITIIFGGFSAIVGVMIYLHSFRIGNRVQITDGDYKDCTATILKYDGFTTPESVHVRLDKGNAEITISPYQIQKVGVRSYIL